MSGPGAKRHLTPKRDTFQTCFVPLNVEIESESEDEIDDSKEIQIEEALKLYQNALKLHSLGSAFYDEAEIAYNELFRSEIFTYPESFSEAQRIELYDGAEDSEDDLDDSLTPTHTVPVISADGAPNSLPQILYLAYKNHGQFILDRLKDQLSRIEEENQSDDVSIAAHQTATAASSSLKLFVEALDRDDTDLELWRKVSRIGNFLGSRRVGRFCLEAVLDTDEGTSDAWTEPRGLEEGFAVEQLKPLLQSLEDQLSESQFSDSSKRQDPIIKSLRKHIDPCPYLPTSSLRIPAQESVNTVHEQIINVPLRTWASCGQAILLQLSQEMQGVINSDPGANYSLALTGKDTATFQPSQPKTTSNSDPASAQNASTTSTRQNLAGPAPVSTGGAANAGIWLGDAEPNQTSPVDMGVQIFEQPMESPTKMTTTDNRDSEKAAANVPEALGPIGTVSLPTRKRSSEAAELPDSTEVGRSRSKRIKARGSIDPDSIRDSTADDWTRWYVQQLQIYHQADNNVFECVRNMLSKLGSEGCGDLQSLREIVSPQSSTSQVNNTKPSLDSANVAALDLKTSLDSWDLVKSKAFLNGHDPKDPAGGISGAQNPSFTAFLEHSNQEMQRMSHLPVLSGDIGMEQFVNRVKLKWMTLGQLSFAWINELLGRHQPLGEDDGPGGDNELESSYENLLWPDTLKQSIVQVLVNQYEAIYSELEAMVDNIEQNSELARTDTSDLGSKQRDRRKNTCMLLIQVIFELHLDIYGRITNPSSVVDTAIRLQQRDRLGRWAAFSSRTMNLRSLHEDDPFPMDTGNDLDHLDRLRIRFMWASVVCNSLLEPDSRDSTVLCFQDLIHVINALERKVPSDSRFVIELPNNAIMPEISVQAAQKEISRLTTMDFFMGVFNSENNDPLTIIESLEPLLELSVKDGKSRNRDSVSVQIPEHTNTIVTTASLGGEAIDSPTQANPDNKLIEALHFLEQGSLPLRLFLWQKLRDAYRAINYPPQVLSCDLRILELIVNHLSSSPYTESAVETRRDSLLRWLHRLDDHMTRILSYSTSKGRPFECVDGDQIRMSLKALSRMQNLLHVFALWEDTIRVGQTPAPLPQNQNASRGLARSTDKFRDMIVKTWTLQHTLLKEAMVQYKEIFPAQNEVLINLLKHMHHALGLRCYCSLANKSFLKMMKAELERAQNVENWETNMAQLIVDLYGVKISSNATEMQDHGCLPEDLDRCTALEIMDLVMFQVNKISIKDLLKSDLKFTVDKMQQVIKIPKILNSPARTFNNRLVNNYFKSPINPLDLYRSLRGIGGLCGSPVHTEGYEIASKGWYFLLGHVALAKFRSQKRTAAGSTDDLEIARTFLRHDLEFDTERWETWYRLAQVFDTMIEEDTTWTAEKLDNRMGELVTLQRRAIHCYSMAVAVATRCADASFEDTSKMADLYADYGTRLYACTREPFSMKAFELDDDHKRHYNSRISGMYKNPPFTSLQLYSAWKLASTLLRRASAQKPQNWIIWYSLGKVLWKMWDFGAKVPGDFKRVDHQLVIAAIVQAIEACPEKRDSRHPEKDPILEPHYKLVSIVHKLVRHGRIAPEEGCRVLKATPYSRKVDDVHDLEHWKPFVLQVLKALRSADKANWYHRMVARAAHIVYDDTPLEPQANAAAKHELNQSIFTKTMAIQVWKPDNERAGRHFVYTSRYVRFFTELLYRLNDKTSLEALARRIRKRTGDFLDHAGLWELVGNAYLKLLRHQPNCRVPEGYAEHKFTGMDPELYQNNAARLETWMHSQTTNPPSLDILREAIELQKLNNKLFKSNLFEDLIRDVYAHLYDSVIPELHAEENRVRMRVDNILTNPTPSVVETPPSDPANAQGEQHRSKAKWVTGREIVRKAEAIAALRAPTVPAKVLKPLAPAPASEQEKPSSSNSNLAVVITADADKDPGSSVPGSVHDSADDESELSEVDEAVVDDKPEEAAEGRPPLFPNLMRAKGTAEDPEEIDTETGGEANEEAEAEDNEDVEMQQEVQPATQVKESGVPEGNW